MTLEFNGKVITKNRYVGSFVMAISMMIFPLIPIGVITILGEVIAHFFPTWYESGLYSSVFIEMWIGGVITLLGVFMTFGRKGSGLSINNGEERST